MANRYWVGAPQKNTYYFDASIAGPTDPNTKWTNDAYAFDGVASASNVATYTVGAAGSTSSNYLEGKGTNAPSSGGAIIEVRARVYGYSTTAPSIHANITTESRAESLGEPTKTGAPESWGSYVTLSTPTGGWTWDKLQKLEVRIFEDNASSTYAGVGKVELEVVSLGSDSSANGQIQEEFSPDSDGNSAVNLNDTTTAAGQSFKSLGAPTLDKVAFRLKKTGSPTGTAVVKIYAHSGTYGTSSVPTGSALATSGTLDVSTLTTSYAKKEFTFTSTNKIRFDNDTAYVAVIEYTSGTSSNYVSVAKQTIIQSGTGNSSEYAGSWTSSSHDLKFGVYTDETNWASTSGGSDNATPPTTADNVYFDANSQGAGLIGAIDLNAHDIDCTGYTGYWNLSGYAGPTAPNAAITCSGSLTLSSSMTNAHVGTGFVFNSSSAETVTSNGIQLTGSTSDWYLTTYNGTGSWTFQDTYIGAIGVAAGTVNTNNQAWNHCNTYVSSGATLNLGTSTVTVDVQEYSGNFDAKSGSIVDGDQATIIFSATTASQYRFAGGGHTYGELRINRGTGGGTTVIFDSNTFGTLKSTTTGAHTIQFQYSTTQTVTSLFDISGSSGNVITIRSTDTDMSKPATIDVNGAVVNSDYLTIQGINATDGTYYAGANSTDSGNNSGWLFTSGSNFLVNYYFDGSDAAASDSGSSWTNVTNADDGDYATDATYTTATGNSSTLKIEGTNAPASGGLLIQVRARAYGSHTGVSSSQTVTIRTDGAAESLGTIAVPASEGWSSYSTLTAPTGGWTWAKVQALEASSVGFAAVSGSGALSRIELEITISGETLSTDQILFEFSAGGTETATLAVVTSVLSVQTVTASYDQIETANVAAISSTLAPQDPTATYQSTQTASVTELSTALSVQTVTATYQSVQTAGISELVTTLVVQDPTANYDANVTAGIAEITSTLTVQDPTATYISIQTAAVDVISIILSVQTTTAVETVAVSADVTEVIATLSVQDTTATYQANLSASVAEVLTVLSVQTTTAAYDIVKVATVTEISNTLSVQVVTATYVSTATATTEPVLFTLSVQDPTATYQSLQTASLDVVGTALSVQTTTASYDANLNAGVTEIATTLSVQDPTATYVQVETASLTEVTAVLSVPTTTATSSSGIVAGTDVLAIALAVQPATATYIQIETATLAAVDLIANLQAVSATYDANLSATVDVLSNTLTVQDLTATYIQVETATVTEVLATVSAQDATATYDANLSASLTVLDATLNVQSLTATYTQVETASLAVVATVLTVNTTTATSLSGTVGDVNVISITLTPQDVTATYIYIGTAGIAEVVTTVTAQDATATYDANLSANVANLDLTASVQNPTPTYVYAESAQLTVIEATLSPPTVTANFDAGTSASVAELLTTLNVPDATASYNANISANTDVLSIISSVPDLTAQAGSIASVNEVLMTLNAQDASATHYGTAIVNELSLTTTINEARVMHNGYCVYPEIMFDTQGGKYYVVEPGEDILVKL